MYFQYIFPRKYKILTIILLVVLLWIIAVKITSNYVISKSSDSESEIVEVKNKERSDKISKGFDIVKSSLTDYTNSISGNLDVRKSIEKGDVKKLFEVLKNYNSNDNISAEIFDKRIEQIYFKGRQLSPEILLLQKALSGSPTTVIKEIGFFTYLVYYTPIRQLDDERKFEGVLITGILIDSKYSATQFDFTGNVFANDFTEEIGEEVTIQPVSRTGGDNQKDTLSSEFGSININSVDNNVIGRIIYPKYTITDHKAGIENYSSMIISILIFMFTALLFPILMRLVNLFKTVLFRIILFLVTILIVRFLWLYNGFPSAFFEQSLFNPQLYASKIGFGLFQSLGDVLVSVLFLVTFALFVVYHIFKVNQDNRQEAKKWGLLKYLISFGVIVASFFVFFNFYGLVIKNLIFNSNIKLLDKSNIIPDTPLFIIQLSILLITFAYLLFNVSILLLLIRYSRNILQFKIYKKFFILFLMLVFIAVNEILNLAGYNFELINLHRTIIIVLLFLFSTYVFKQNSTRKVFQILSLRNVSLLLLMCIIITPIVILEFTKSQETFYVENIGAELVEDQSDKIIFLLSDELGKIKEDMYIEKYFGDVQKTQKLPYYIWSSSKLSYEKYKADVILLDTSKKFISDFNNSNNLIKSDSVISFIKRAYFSKNFNAEADESDTTDSDIIEEDIYLNETTEPLFIDNVIILENKTDKYFVGILPVENYELRNTQFAEVKGYIVVVLNSETINLFTDNEFTGNINLQSERISDRLISKPVITEIFNEEVINSTDLEVSKSALKFVDLFNESIKASEKKNGWRYDPLVNERYRSYYIKVPERDEKLSYDERIFIVSIKRDDFGLQMFYFLKFVLFSLVVFIAFNLLYSTKFLFNIRSLNFDFKTKLFLSFIVVSVIPIVFLAVYTRTYINNKNDLGYKSQLLSDLSLLNETLKDEKILFNKFKPADTIKQAGREILSKSFENIDKNFNIFVKSNLIATTNDELYKSDFLDTRVPEDGYFNILILKKDLFLESKEIQGQSYLVGYKPLKDRNNNINGIISSLSVYKQKEIQEELTETLTFIFGSYLIVIIILFALVAFITAKLAQPISMLQEATERIAQGEENVVLEMDRNDEFGSLVESFNKMTRDLAKSKDKLKRVEREAAWRDIARRVAHEIKNPLTPMKLSIQHLYNIYQEKDFTEFEIVLKKTKELIIKEIDKLNKIATAFSDFAKLPQRNYQPLNINEVLEDVISLYSLNNEIKIVKDLSADLNLVWADKQEMNRVFQNILKNSVQSFEGNGVIEVRSFNSPTKVIVEIKDNGCGIDPEILGKLFEPNFSTKSTGMGLGLAITKKSLDDMKARISFNSKLGEGTTVVMNFIRYEEK